MKNHKELFSYYLFFNNPIIVLIRFGIFIVFLLLLLISIQEFDRAKIILFVYSIFLANELFIHLKVNKMRPEKTVTLVSADTLETAVFFRALRVYVTAQSGADLAKNLLHFSENKFLLRKIIGAETLSAFVPVDKGVLLQKAYALVVSVNGEYISIVDLFAAYILLSENSSKILEQSDMDEQDFLNIYYWARNYYKVDDRNKPLSLTFYGDGAFDFFVFGWSTELKKYARSITSSVLSKKHIPRVIGRGEEYEQLLVALSNRDNRNVLLIGEPGTGKTTLIEFFAYNSHLGKVPAEVAHMHVYELFIDRLLAGVDDRGELENRLITIIDEVGHAGNVVLLIQNIENIFGAGGFDFDLSGVLYEYLKAGSITLIGTTTKSAYKNNIASHDAISSVFTPIELQLPDRKTALYMLFEKIGDIEQQYEVDITYSAVSSVVDLSDSYYPDRALPGKAVTVLENISTAQRIKGKVPVLTREIVEAQLSAQTHILIGNPTKEEKDLLLHLEEKLHERVVSQERAVTVVANAMRRVRSGLKSGHRPIATFLFLGQTGVGKTETAKALAEVYFGSESSMIRLDMSEYQTQDSLSRLLGESVGGQYSEHAFTEQVAQKPFSLILLDEFEKAHPQILNIFLQVFEDGRLTDNKGRTVSFQNAIIIATSNAGSEYIREHVGQVTDEKIFNKHLLDMLMQSHVFAPELVNRFDEVVVFSPLNREELTQVTKLLLEQELSPLQEKQIEISFDDLLVDKVVSESYDEQFGARNIRRYITDTVSGYVSELLLKDMIKKGSVVTLTVDSQNQIAVR